MKTVRGRVNSFAAPRHQRHHLPTRAASSQTHRASRDDASRGPSGQEKVAANELARQNDELDPHRTRRHRPTGRRRDPGRGRRRPSSHRPASPVQRHRADPSDLRCGRGRTRPRAAVPRREPTPQRRDPPHRRCPMPLRATRPRPLRTSKSERPNRRYLTDTSLAELDGTRDTDTSPGAGITTGT